MNFCIDNIDDQLVIDSDQEGINTYKFCGIKAVDEAELFRVFKRNRFKSQKANSSIDMFTPKNGIVPKGVGPNQIEPELHFPFSGLFLIPKLFGYFPFLDCDSEDDYVDAIFHLTLANIPFKAYQSNPKRKAYWIFCDKQGTLNDTLDFIESYPGDHRYSWIARHKNEMCVRAVPKYNAVPLFDDDHLVSSYTDDFKYWIKKFDEYWEHGLIPTYIMNVATLNAL